MFIVWPGRVDPNSVCREPVISTDFYPTILDMAGLQRDPSQHMDGISLTPLLEGEPTLDRENLYWHYPHYHGSGARPHGAMRSGDWKLLEFYEDNSIELYNLAEDMGELNETSADEPELAAAMREQFQQWRKEVNAQMPEPNPNYQPSG
jgi:arylsulfatase A-like enzyme